MEVKMIDAFLFSLNYLIDRVKSTKNVESYYTRIGDDVLPSLNDKFAKPDKQLWLNLGYWKDSDTYPDACLSLARLVANKVGLNSDDTVLDVGFGFGEQDLVWVKEYDVKHISGINITKLHIDYATNRIKNTEFESRINFQFGDATKIPFKDNNFTKIVALESAFHFNTRETFFEEAYRVLQTGGKLVIADMIPLPKEKFSSIWKKRGRKDLVLPDENMYDLHEYQKKLIVQGFKNVEIISIAGDVYGGIRKYIITRALNKKRPIDQIKIKVTEKDKKRGIRMWHWLYGTSDYIIAIAEK